MILEKGNKIDINVENKSGVVDILITDNMNKEIYKVENSLTSDFIFEIPESNTYKFFVTGNKAKGGVSFIVQE